MTETAVDRQKMIQQAVGALQSGNSFQARGLFEKIVKFPEADPTAWLGLAFACAHQGDAEAALAAVDNLLELEPDNLRGNIFKADHQPGFRRHARPRQVTDIRIPRYSRRR